MRVAVDCRLMLRRKAGIAQYTRSLVRALASTAPPASRAQVCAILDRRDADAGWVPPGVRVVRTVTPAHHPYERFALPLELAARRIDVLHSPDFITARGRFRKVVTVHDLYFLEHPEAMSPDGARYYGRIGWSVRAAGAVIAVSHFTRAEILRLLPGTPPGKVRVIHEAPALNPAPARPADPPYALFVGTFEPRKNLGALLRALDGQPDDFRLVIVGEMGWVPSSEPARIAAEAGVSGRVFFAGRVSDQELDGWYAGARLLAFPSLSEGFGLPVLDAMARGVPVVCSNAGALPEVAGDAALMHDPLDASALARLMRQAWTDDALRVECARRGLRRARVFSWERAARETWEAYSASGQDFA
jgi:glycosyltransferase involved in cell wall biosynthesis